MGYFEPFPVKYREFGRFNQKMSQHFRTSGENRQSTIPVILAVRSFPDDENDRLEHGVASIFDAFSASA
jgi:hypothetical protein